MVLPGEHTRSLLSFLCTRAVTKSFLFFARTPMAVVTSKREHRVVSPPLVEYKRLSEL